MSIATLNPWQVLDQLQKDALRNYSTPQKTSPQKWHPPVDIAEHSAGYTITMDAPGIATENVSITVEENKLKVEGHRAENKKATITEQRFHYKERMLGSFSRTFQLPKDADANLINAAFDAGVLSIEVPKLEKSQPRSIQIQSK